MSNGLKSGSADDPWEDDEEDTTSDREAATSASETTSTSDREPTTTEAPSPSSRTSEPYLARRDGAKDERKLIQFFLREDVYGEMAESRVRAAVGEDLGELPGKFDLREALVAVGQEHVDEVVDELREMGY